MNKFTLEKTLAASFEDHKLDNNERRELAAQLDAAKVQADDLAFLRNRAFGYVQQHIRDGGEPLVALKWLEHVVKQFDNARPQPTGLLAESWFSPGNDCFDGICHQLQHAAATVDICVFTIADDNLTKVILDTHNRGVKVRIITDNDKVNDRGSDIDFLVRQGIPVKVDQTDYHMHHKFAIFDQARLINGSFNWTRSASRYNEEDLTLTDDKRHIDAFCTHFEGLWRRFPDYQG
ncbi:hypothetical protein JCM19237_1307 [Photobacterium aphoticum]|uniref:phospholipase D n=1 Tax=Photobacterium aphoticum TaxID=754436 RepID=A0A090QNA8_9GAMM|nr:hypothetical protein JCM19237_1307 [Photobacterium aphoticum]